MYAGRVVERGRAERAVRAPAAPVHLGPAAARSPRLDRDRRRTARSRSPGLPPEPRSTCPSGCPFHPRCPYAGRRSAAVSTRRAAETDAGHWAACHLSSTSSVGDLRWPSVAPSRDRRPPRPWQRRRRGRRAAACRSTWLKVHFPVTRGVLVRASGAVRAVDGISFDAAPGETLGLVGESGCGKTTTGRAHPAARAAHRRAASLFDGARPGRGCGGGRLRPLRRDMQMIFQDPYASLNPRHDRRQHRRRAAADPRAAPAAAAIETRVQELLELVGLSPEHYNRYPHEFSGGQRQRIGIARALALSSPKLIIVATSRSRRSTCRSRRRSSTCSSDLQRRARADLLFIAHDLAVVRHIADRVAVMYLGKIVELADGERAVRGPLHPYTQALLSAVPIPDPRPTAASSGGSGSPASPHPAEPAVRLPVPHPLLESAVDTARPPSRPWRGEPESSGRLPLSRSRVTARSFGAVGHH